MTDRRDARKLARAIRSLREGDNFEKEKAIDYLVSVPDRNTVEKLIPILHDENTGARMAVMDVLKKIGSEGLEAITTLLDDENEDLRVYGCELLGALKDPRGLPYLIKKVYEDDENVRNTAVMFLGEFDDSRAVKALLDALKDSDWVRFSAIYSLGKIGTREAVEPLLELFRSGEEEVSLAACEVLVDLAEDDEVLDGIIGALKSWDRSKRDPYLRVILEKGDETVFGRLKDRIEEELFAHLIHSVREEKKKSPRVLRLIANFKTAEACEVILEAIRQVEPDSEEYEEILGLLADMGDAWSDNIRNFLQGEEDRVIPMIRASVMAGIQIDEELLLTIFRSSSVGVRREIVKGVQNIVVGDGHRIIAEAIKDPDGHVKGDAVSVIGARRMKQFEFEVAGLAGAGFFDVRVKALRVLVDLNRDLSVNLVKQFVDEGSKDDKRIYLAVAGLLDGGTNLPLLEKVLFDPEEQVRRGAIGVLGGFLDDSRYVGLFKGLLMQEDVPHEALKVAKERPLKEFKGRLVEIFSDTGKGLWTRYYTLSALSAFREKDLAPVFLKGLEEENSLMKIGSMKALSDLNDSDVIPYIMPLTASTDDDVRSTAEFVLSKLRSS
jgi:HEAT repeat protein